MKVLFITSEHPARLFGGLGTFTREFTLELKKHAEVKVVLFNLGPEKPPKADHLVDVVLCTTFAFEAFSLEARILENAASFRAQLDQIIHQFKPDIIHCNDRQTYLPFRFNTNVFYSSHLLYCDMLSMQALDDVYFQELKIERCALSRAAGVAVYSSFAAKRVNQLLPHTCSPIILPLGFDSTRFISKKEPGKLRIAFFGRFENVQKGVVHFINAVNLLGSSFFASHNVELSLYGKGEFGTDINVTLFKNVGFLQGDDLIRAYAETDIVVMPSRYEPFGLVGLEAMAAGCLLLATAGQGMDEYAVGGKTCVTIPSEERGIASILNKVISNFQEYIPIAEAGRKAVQIWTWKRAVVAHMKVYQQIINGNHEKLTAAYRSELTNVNNMFQTSDVAIRDKEVEKIHFLLKKCAVVFSDSSNLFITVGQLNNIGESNNALVVSVTEKDSDGVNPRLECLFYNNDQFECVCVVGAWESVFQPKFALGELFRIASKRIVIVYRTGSRLPWQTIMMEGDQDWSDLQGKGESLWGLVSEKQISLFSDTEYSYVEWLKKGV